VIFAGGLAAAPLPLTLEKTLADAETVNLTVLINREFVTQSEQTVRTARSIVLPDVALRASQFRRDTGAADPSNDFGAGLYGSMPLFDLRAFDSLKAVKKSVDVSRQRYEQAVQQVLAAVAGAYFDHRRNLAYERVIDANIERAKVLLELARNRLRAGVATQIDVTRAEAELLTAEQARLQQQTITVGSALRLKRLLNLDLNAAIELDPFEVRRDLDQGVRSLPLEMLLERRADYQAALGESERLHYVRRAYARERVPTIEAVAQGGVTTETAFDGNEEEFWAAGLQLSVPVFEGNRIDANVRRTDSEIRQAEYDRQDLERSIDSEFRIALQDVESQLAQITVAEKNLALAGEELRLARVRYEQGVADNRELIDAENRYAATSFNLVRSLYSYHVARVELARVRGDVRLILQERATASYGPVPITPQAPAAPAAPVPSEPAPAVPAS
jgi:outer membrane protein TolC